MKVRVKISPIFILTIIIYFSCTKETLEPEYLTENIIIVVIDGARFSETWGDSSHQYIPQLSNALSKYGVINTRFYNNGSTYTVPGHTCITTGYYQEIDNSGKELPMYPSIFQYWNALYLHNNIDTWIISSKDKLEVLNNCRFTEYKDSYMPSTNCGISGLGSGNRNDSITFEILISILKECHPHLVLVNFREPDFSAHTGKWNKYIDGIKSSDEYAFKIWEFIQEDNHYKGKTALFITNDHGRHLDSIANGFISHGDNCLGCRHINFYAFGPDFKENVILDKERELIDISATISEIIHLNIRYGHGKVMYELFNEH